MYTSPFTEMTDRAAMQALVDEVGVASWITVSADGHPEATLLPVLWRGDRVIAHAAAANPQFQQLAQGAPGLAVITGANAYVSPNWLPTKAKAGRAVPTWNYLSVQLAGPVTVHRDREWLLAAVEELSVVHERTRTPAWSLDEAPQIFTDGLLLGVVGLEMTVTSAVGKAKLSQNRIPADREGIIAGLRQDQQPRAAALADAMEAAEQGRTSLTPGGSE